MHLTADQKTSITRHAIRIYFATDYTWTDNKFRELATVCLPWQHWTKALVWFDDVDISEFHSCVVVGVVVDLWLASSFWVASIPVCVCFGVPPRECRNLN